MKILSLNTWGGRAGRGIQLDFFRNMGGDADIFCLQEVWSAPYENYQGTSAGGVPIDHNTIMTDGLQQITNVLSSHEYFFNPHLGDNYGLLMLVRKGMEVIGSGEAWVHMDRGYIPEGDIGHHARNIQFVDINTENGEYRICNFHGLWNGKGKTDSSERIEQSKKIVDFLRQKERRTVIIGDFNLLPGTESVGLLERSYRNLIKEYAVKTTRTSLYTKQEKYADYAFVGEDIIVKNFSILQDEVSDHAPLLLEIT